MTEKQANSEAERVARFLKDFGVGPWREVVTPDPVTYQGERVQWSWKVVSGPLSVHPHPTEKNCYVAELATELNDTAGFSDPAWSLRGRGAKFFDPCAAVRAVVERFREFRRREIERLQELAHYVRNV